MAYGNLRFAARVGFDAYETVNDRINPGLFAGDWLFAQNLFGDAVDPKGYAEKLRQFAGSPEVYETVMSLVFPRLVAFEDSGSRDDRREHRSGLSP